jgi:hypothetical protein
MFFLIPFLIFCLNVFFRILKSKFFKYFSKLSKDFRMIIHLWQGSSHIFDLDMRRNGFILSLSIKRSFLQFLKSSLRSNGWDVSSVFDVCYLAYSLQRRTCVTLCFIWKWILVLPLVGLSRHPATENLLLDS